MALADAVSFQAAAAGTGPFVFQAARASFRTPSQAVSDGALIDGQIYSYLAQDLLAAPTQREWGRAVFTAAGTSFARTPLGGVSVGADTGRSPVNFLVAPIVSLTILAEDTLTGQLYAGAFGVVGNGSSGGGASSPPTGTDDSAAIQLTIDTQAYGAQQLGLGIGGGFAVLPPLGFRISSPLQVGYGDRYVAGRLKGAGAAFNGSPAFGTALLVDYSDAPAIALNMSLRGQVTDIGLFGMNYNFVSAGQLSTCGTSQASWVDPALAANANSRYAPYAAVVLDGYCGAAPSPAYRNRSFPSWSGISTQYGAGHGSDNLIERLDIAGFVVGVVQTPSNSDGNGDFTRIRDCRIVNCVYGISVGQTQSRNLMCMDVFMSGVHTGFTTNKHGLQNGRFSSTFLNCHVGNAIQLFDLNTAIGGPTTFRNVYAEALYQIGTIASGGASTLVIILDDCPLNFEAQMGNGGGTQGAPAYILPSTGTVNLVRIIGGYWNNYIGTAFIQQPVSSVTIRDLLLSQQQWASAVTPKPYEAFGFNATMAGLMFTFMGSNAPPGEILPRYGNYNLDTQAGLATYTPAPTYLSNRTICTPLWSSVHTGSQELSSEGVTIPPRVGTYDWGDAGWHASASQSGRTLTLTMAAGWTADAFMVQGPSNGDVILHNDTGSIYYVSDVVGQVVTAVMQNNYKIDGTTPITAPTFTGGIAFIGNSRCYSPIWPIYGDFTSGSPTIANVGRPDGYNGAFTTNLAVGDYIYFGALNDFTLSDGYAKITAMDGVLNTITLDRNAAQTVAHKRLGTFIRTPPANQ